MKIFDIVLLALLATGVLSASTTTTTTTTSTTTTKSKKASTTTTTTTTTTKSKKASTTTTTTTTLPTTTTTKSKKASTTTTTTTPSTTTTSTKTKKSSTTTTTTTTTASSKTKTTKTKTSSTTSATPSASPAVCASTYCNTCSCTVDLSGNGMCYTSVDNSVSCTSDSTCAAMEGNNYYRCGADGFCYNTQGCPSKSTGSSVKASTTTTSATSTPSTDACGGVCGSCGCGQRLDGTPVCFDEIDPNVGTCNSDAYCANAEKASGYVCAPSNGGLCIRTGGCQQPAGFVPPPAYTPTMTTTTTTTTSTSASSSATDVCGGVCGSCGCGQMLDGSPVCFVSLDPSNTGCPSNQWCVGMETSEYYVCSNSAQGYCLNTQGCPQPAGYVNPNGLGSNQNPTTTTTTTTASTTTTTTSSTPASTDAGCPSTGGFCNPSCDYVDTPGSVCGTSCDCDATTEGTSVCTWGYYTYQGCSSTSDCPANYICSSSSGACFGTAGCPAASSPNSRSKKMVRRVEREFLERMRRNT